jgi:hypothetical protein
MRGCGRGRGAVRADHAFAIRSGHGGELGGLARVSRRRGEAGGLAELGKQTGSRGRWDKRSSGE